MSGKNRKSKKSLSSLKKIGPLLDYYETLKHDIPREIDVEIVWSGTGVDEVGKDKITGDTRVKISPKFFRPTEVDNLLGDASKAKTQLGWEPEITFDELVKEMVLSDIELMKGNPNA